MAWVRIDDGFTQHPKVVQAGPLGIAMQIAGLCYCNRYLTDGFIPRAVVPNLLNLEGIAMRVWDGELFGGGEDATWQLVVSDLIAAGLWEEVEGGYRIHDYLDYQPSRADVLRERGIARRRNAMNSDPNLTRAVRQRDGDFCRYCGARVDWKDRKSPHGGTYDHVIPVSQGGDESVDNIVVCCRQCNTMKGARSPEEAQMSLRPTTQQAVEKTKTESRRNLDGIKPESRHPDPDPKESTQESTSRNLGTSGTKQVPHVGGQAADASRSPRSPKETVSDEQRVMDCYNQTFSGLWARPLRLTPDRKAKIKARLSTYTADEICQAIKNIRASPFHCGENDSGKIYATPEFVCRNDGMVDKWLNTKAPKGEGEPERVVTDEAAYLAEVERRQAEVEALMRGGET